MTKTNKTTREIEKEKNENTVAYAILFTIIIILLIIIAYYFAVVYPSQDTEEKINEEDEIYHYYSVTEEIGNGTCRAVVIKWCRNEEIDYEVIFNETIRC